MRFYAVTSVCGTRLWQADDENHAREQQEDCFPGDPYEEVLDVRLATPAEIQAWGYATDAAEHQPPARCRRRTPRR